MHTVRLGRSDLHVSPICLGTMTFGEQVDESGAHAILDRAVERGVNFLDTAEMYAVPPRAETCGATERILGQWWAKAPSKRDRVVLATKVAGPSRGMPWIRGGAGDVTAADITLACEGSLRRLQTEVIDLYQIHWPVRHVPMFGAVYFEPEHLRPCTSMEAQLRALDQLVREGKVRAVGLSNETPYGLSEFIRLAEQFGLPRVATVQNPYGLLNRSVDNGLDEVMHHHQVSLLAYSPLAFGLLTGKYDAHGIQDPAKPGRMAIYPRMQQQRWGRPEALDAARLYNQLARDHGLTPTQLALAFCYRRWNVASTIIGVTSLAQLNEDLDAWDVPLTPELWKAIDAIRWERRDPCQ